MRLRLLVSRLPSLLLLSLLFRTFVIQLLLLLLLCCTCIVCTYVVLVCVQSMRHVGGIVTGAVVMLPMVNAGYTCC